MNTNVCYLSESWFFASGIQMLVFFVDIEYYGRPYCTTTSTRWKHVQCRTLHLRNKVYVMYGMALYIIRYLTKVDRRTWKDEIQCANPV